MRNFFYLLRVLLFLFQVIITNNAYSQWNLINTPTASDYKSVFFLNNDTGFVVGNQYILKTTDGGNNWNISNMGLNTKLTDVIFINNDTGFVTGNIDISKRFILRTIDSGNSWDTAYVANSVANLYSVQFVNDSIGYCVGFATVLKTTDYGNTWLSLNAGLSSFFYSLFFVNADTGYIVGSDWVILKTIDGGNSFTQLTPTGGGPYTYHSVYFLNVDTGFVVGYAATGPTSTIPVIQETINGGASWTHPVSSLSYKLKDVFFTSSDTGFIVGGLGQIEKTIDGGNSWLPDNIIWGNLNSIHFPNSLTGFIAGDNGVLLKTVNGGIVSVQDIKSNFLGGIFPNPASQLININMKDENYPLNITIYDILGVEILKLNNYKDNSMNVSTLKSGLYFIVIETKDGERATAKLVKR